MKKNPWDAVMIIRSQPSTNKLCFLDGILDHYRIQSHCRKLHDTACTGPEQKSDSQLCRYLATLVITGCPCYQSGISKNLCVFTYNTEYCHAQYDKCIYKFRVVDWALETVSKALWYQTFMREHTTSLAKSTWFVQLFNYVFPHPVLDPQPV